MKYPGSISDFTQMRNDELIRAFRKVFAQKTFFDITKDYEQVVNMPCSRFWISEARASIVVSAIMRGQPILNTMRPTKREMFLEIYNRVLAIREKKPDTPLIDIVFEVVNSPAPKFYMKPRHARNIIYKMKNGHYKK